MTSPTFKGSHHTGGMVHGAVLLLGYHKPMGGDLAWRFTRRAEDSQSKFMALKGGLCGKVAPLLHHQLLRVKIPSCYL
jgi:hypothetical protein